MPFSFFFCEPYTELSGKRAQSEVNLSMQASTQAKMTNSQRLHKERLREGTFAGTQGKKAQAKDGSGSSASATGALMPRVAACAVLGLPPTASPEDIRRSFRQQSLKYHPDYNSSPGAREQFEMILAAYRVLNPKGGSPAAVLAPSSSDTAIVTGHANSGRSGIAEKSSPSKQHSAKSSNSTLRSSAASRISTASSGSFSNVNTQPHRMQNPGVRGSSGVGVLGNDRLRFVADVPQARAAESIAGLIRALLFIAIIVAICVSILSLVFPYRSGVKAGSLIQYKLM